ncbi:MAG: hypothetical protein CMI22_10855 [Opitutae bacterium]|nr:hypothetical protein [Opitutae bacterium]
MNSSRPISTDPKVERKRGFALVMALSLLSLVFLLVVSLINLVGTDLSLSEVRKERILAKAHARVGMMVAIGEIQKHLGPDTRISATADLLDERIVSGQNYESDSLTYDFSESAISRDDLQWIDLNEDGQINLLPKGQRYWTGVWKHRARRKDALERAAKPLPKNAESAKTINSQVMYDSEFDPHPAVEVAWLVSGNEGFQKKLILGNDPYADDAFVELMDGVYPEDENFNAWADYEESLDDLYEPQNNPDLGKYWHPKEPLYGATDLNDNPSNTTWILKAPLLSASFADDLENASNEEGKKSVKEKWADYLKGEPVLVPKTELSLEGTPEDRPNSGRSISRPAYAYWVGDEGVKSKFGMDFDKPSDLLEVSSDLKRQIDANSVARKPNFSLADEQNPSTGGFGIELPEEAYEEEQDVTSLGLLSNLLRDDQDGGQLAKNKIGAHYHSLTMDSFGVLADARTGGLKRDLSSAFLNDEDINDDKWDLEREDRFWAQDFENFIYKHKESLYKTVPLVAGAGGNQWNDTASTELRFEEAILGGPRWSVLGAFHNLYSNNLNGDSQFSNLLSDEFPRTTGDNDIVFDPDGDFLNYLDRFGNNLDQVTARYNFFEEIFTRAEPENHGLQPILCEIKYSQVPTVENGRLAMAMYPSVALWNPYSAKISVDQLFLEIPFHHAFLRAVDPRDFDRWRKWKMYNCHSLRPDSPEGGGAGGGGGNRQISGPDWRPDVPSGYFGAVGALGALGPFSRFPHLLSTQQATGETPWPKTYSFNEFYSHYFDYAHIRNRSFNGNGRQEPNYNYWPAYDPDYDVAEPNMHSPERINNDDAWLEDRTNSIPFIWVTERPDQDNYKILSSAVNGRNVSGRVENTRRERHLLLSMQNVILEAGEKAHFTVNGKQIWNFQPPLGKVPGTPTPREYLEVSLAKGVDQDPFVCLTDHSASDPLILRTTLTDVMGTDPSDEGEKFDMASRRSGLSSAFLEPRGITMYSEAPYESTSAYNYPEDTQDRKISKAPDQKKYLWKLGRRFDFNLGDPWIAFGGNSNELSRSTEMGTDLMKGNGFRIRLQLPSDSKSVVLEQFNLRALVHSFQDGFGDNWTLEQFKGNGYGQSGLNAYRVLSNADLQAQVYRIANEDENYVATFRAPGTGYPNADINRRRPQFDYLDLYYLPSKVTPGLTLNDFNGTGRTPSFPTNVFEAMVPRINESSSLAANAETSIGHYHHEMQRHGPIRHSSSAVLFEVPSMPLLSMIQFRHANLNNYSHGPSYSLGNSYASTQVGRYKVTGLVRGIDIVPHPAIDAFNPGDNDASQRLWRSPVLGSRGESFENWVMGGRDSPWETFRRRHNFRGTDKVNVRDREVSQEHENVTLDHTYLNNRALLDGYFLSGLGSPDVNDNEYRDYWSRKSPDEFEPGRRHRPYRNPRLTPYLRTDDKDLEDWEVTGYADLDEQLNPSRDEIFKYQTLAADLLLEGAFNVNSTSVDAWFSQLSALAGQALPKSGGGALQIDEEDTAFPRYSILPSDAQTLSYVENATNSGTHIWNEVRVLTKDEISLLAHCLVEQIKLRGPFLSYADFVNRRVQAKRENVLGKHMTEWGWPMDGSSGEVRENRETMLGMRGAVQAAIAEAEINRGGFGKPGGNSVQGQWEENPQIPKIPEQRFDLNTPQLGLYPTGQQFAYLSSVFGIHAFHWRYETVPDEWDQQGTQRKVSYLKPEYQDPRNPSQYVREEIEFGADPKADRGSKSRPPMAHIARDNTQSSIFWRIQSKSNKRNLGNGEAPDSIMAIENLATAANKPGWLMQSDVLSPLAPVTSARSDTFVIRVMGETWSERDVATQRILKNSSKSWIELTVQRTPDYVKSDLDAPHRRPHEPFEDRNLNGYWDDDSSVDEHWLDLNENGDYVQQPDLPGVGEGQGNRFRDGLKSDLPLARDPNEESDTDDISIMGINQRFGRKFKIIKFRWLKEQDV